MSRKSIIKLDLLRAFDSQNMGVMPRMEFAFFGPSPNPIIGQWGLIQEILTQPLWEVLTHLIIEIYVHVACRQGIRYNYCELNLTD